MKSRWLINIVMLAIVLGLGTYFYLRPKPEAVQTKAYDISQIKLADIVSIQVDLPNKPLMTFKKVNKLWQMIAPYPARLDQQSINHIISVVAAQSNNKFSSSDLAKFGLNEPKLKLTLNEELFIFGAFNSVTSEQYVMYKDAIYLLPGSYLELASIQTTALLDKSPIAQDEKIIGFDLSGLEQWQENQLNVDLVDGKWQVNDPKLSVNQAAMQEWFDGYWTGMSVSAVEPYSLQSTEKLPGFSVKLSNGKTIRFDKFQESPTLILGRPDEGIKYTIASDIGFVLLNPPLESAK